MKKAWIFILILFVHGCVADSVYQEALSENRKLKSEIEELKYGVPKLLSEAKALFKNGDFLLAREKINLLSKKHPEAIETTEAEKMLPTINEEILWQSIQKEKKLGLVDEYLHKYPKGKYSKYAHKEKRRIIKKKERDEYEVVKTKNTISAFNLFLEEHPRSPYKRRVKAKISALKKAGMKSAYRAAKRKNTSYAWKKFLKEYPRHPERNEIKQKIIALKVDEIMGGKNTGHLPSFSRTTFGNNSRTSTVSIQNDTGRKLIVRYSGRSIEEIVISVGSLRTTTLLSGSYKIAASAGGLHYAGVENLSGDYTSTYYISTTRY